MKDLTKVDRRSYRSLIVFIVFVVSSCLCYFVSNIFQVAQRLETATPGVRAGDGCSVRA